MSSRSDEDTFLKKLLSTFRVEAEDHLRAITKGLLALEGLSQWEEQRNVLEDIFREAHSLKGAARAVDLHPVESICQALEGQFAKLKSQESALSKELLDDLHSRLREIENLLSPVEESSKEAGSLSSRNDLAPPPSASRDVSPRAEQNLPSLDNLKISASRLSSLVRQIDELVPLKVAAAQRIVELKRVQRLAAQWEREIHRVKALAHFAPSSEIFSVTRDSEEFTSEDEGFEDYEAGKISTFLRQNEDVMRTLQREIADILASCGRDRRALDRSVEELVSEAKQLVVAPFSILTESFPKLVRDLSHDCGKNVKFVVSGEELEIDRRILDEIKDPLIHLIRNGIDHGVEYPEQRAAKGKSPQAVLSCIITPHGADKVEIRLSDDGAGIDPAKVKRAAENMGLISKSAASSADLEQTVSLIFQSGLTTSTQLTSVSGRGLGLAIVKEKVEKIGGFVSTETQLGKGTTFLLHLPMTLARFRGVLVRSGEGLYVVPTQHVVKVSRAIVKDIRLLGNKETAQIGGRTATVFRLVDLLKSSTKSSEFRRGPKLPMVVLRWEGETIGLLVDEIFDEREVLVKSFGKNVRSIPPFAGATILENGKVVPILDIPELMRHAVAPARPSRSSSLEEVPKSILIAEDSITSRALIKNVLELAGYRVKAAVDGAEALEMLKAEKFNLLVSDVEMPRMNGFDLISKVRGDESLASIPIVLVTGLSNKEHKERGLELGANAYIEKGSFDQENLVQVVRRLL